MGTEIAQSANLLLTLILMTTVLSITITIVSLVRLYSGAASSKIDRDLNSVNIKEIHEVANYDEELPATAVYQLLDRNRALFMDDDGNELISGNVDGVTINSIEDLSKVFNYKIRFVIRQEGDSLYSLEVTRYRGYR